MYRLFLNVVIVVFLCLSLIQCDKNEFIDSEEKEEEKEELVIEKSFFIKFCIGEEYSAKHKPYQDCTYMNLPQIVFWMEDTAGNFISTLMCTQKSATGSWAILPYEDTIMPYREYVLPYWANKRNVKSYWEDIDGNTGATTPSMPQYMPNSYKQLVDGVTCATPIKDFKVELDTQLLVVPFKLFAEINKPVDFNEVYKANLYKGDDFYNGDEYGNGQPSLLYSVLIDTNCIINTQSFVMEGWCSPYCSSPRLGKSLDNISTALHITDSILFLVEHKLVNRNKESR